MPRPLYCLNTPTLHCLGTYRLTIYMQVATYEVLPKHIIHLMLKDKDTLITKTLHTSLNFTLI